MSEGTKGNILDAALELFANKGYQGTSIRDISHAAQVNVASINYHFGSKEKLFQEVVVQSMIIMDNSLRNALDADNISLGQAAWKMYKVFGEQESAVLSLFRVFFSEQVEFPDSPIKFGDLIAPPGSNYLFDIIKRESGTNNPNAIMWGVAIISSHIIHCSVMRSTPFGKQCLVDLPFYQDDFKQQSLKILATAVVEQIKRHKTGWPTCYKDDLG